MKLLRFWRDLRIRLDQNKKVENILKDNQENEDEGGQNFIEYKRIIQEF